MMALLQMSIETLLILLLAATLFHALRLERARSGIKRDHGELERLIHGFDESNRQAEAGAERLRMAADSAGRAMSRQVEGASNLKDELSDLIERGERLASRLGSVVRNELAPLPQRPAPPPPPPLPMAPPMPEPELAVGTGPRVRSQAERDLLRALRVTR